MQETSISPLKRIAGGGSDADWQRLIQIYRPFMYQHISAYPLLINQAEDIVQEVLIVLVRELPTFQHQRTGAFRTFLRGIVLNQLRCAMRRVQKTPLVAGQFDKMSEYIERLTEPNSQVAAEFDQEHDKVAFRHASEIVKGKSSRALGWRFTNTPSMASQPLRLQKTRCFRQRRTANEKSPDKKNSRRNPRPRRLTTNH
ncbi:RNA polymerase sigma factor [Planctomycetaceae bacterium SH139]